MKKTVIPYFGAVALIVFLALTASLVFAGDEGPSGENQSPSQVNEDVLNYIPIQGKLTDASGNPINGVVPIKFRLYDVLTGGTELCFDNNSVEVVNGLFSSEIWGNCQNQMNGKQLYLSIEVNGNGEMEPRQPIYAVPYAWSLRPNASIVGSVNSDAILHIDNTSPSGRGLRAYATSPTGTNYGVVGASVSPDGFGGYFYNSMSGTGLQAESSTGIALKTSGTGVIQSTANSYLWISGNGVRPFHQSDSTIIDMDTVGGARVTGGAAGYRNVMLPITITAPLYGQNVTVTGLEIYYATDTGSDAVTAVLFRRQTGVCETASCYAALLTDFTDLPCDDSAHPTGCSHHYNITTNNVLTANSGILYLTIEMNFSTPTSWIRIGGVRLTLKHD